MSDPTETSGDDGPTPRPEAPAALLLIGVGREFERRVRAALAEKGLKPRAVYVLDVLAQQGAVGQRELGEMLGIDHSILVTVLNPLEADGLIERRRSEEDRRRHDVVITAAGRRALKKGMATIEAVQADLLGVLDEDSRDDLRRALQVVRAGIVKRDGPTAYSTDDECASGDF